MRDNVFYAALGPDGHVMQPPNQKAHADQVEVLLPHRTILQVEDNAANALLVEKLIGRRSDLVLLTATRGSQGIEMAIAHMPDVILMDINMPDISGLAALAILRANPLTSHIPVIALSSNAYPTDIKEGLEAGFFRYLTKPFKISEFMDAVDLALQQATG
jgi:CheY-like chemotaxis protein